MPKEVKMEKTNGSTSVDGFRGMWHQKGQLCPKGTVPVRRSSMQDVLRAKSLYNFGKKSAQFLPLAATTTGGGAAVPNIAGNGHEVSPEMYGDRFVQTNSRIAIGAAISPVSSIAGDQSDITILIWKDPKPGNWWLGFGDRTLVGYWPAELTTNLSDRATMVEWGGEVVNSRPNNQHTSTQMGSGRFGKRALAKPVISEI
ncbi:hypothetical protein SASPL_136941 [Salvia splendens]|uniref:Neprosin PEP catalytic domain-containing protein n=1 Tax=Salvia splendens TaxID=180675 RepID=A0A8X8X2W5_SALSN|nr:hypothetical protein SASPL_136941 [Salvia splendens]